MGQDLYPNHTYQNALGTIKEMQIILWASEKDKLIWLAMRKVTS